MIKQLTSNKKERYIFFMPAGEMQYAAVNFLKSNNFKVILCDANPKAFLKSYADIFLNFDIFDVRKCEKILNQLRKKFNIVGAYTASSDCHKSIAHISDKVGSKLTWTKDISNLCFNKYKARKFLSNLCNQPLFNKISHFNNLKFYEKVYGLREVVLKPLDSSGSRGFQKFKNIHHITKKNFNYTKSYSRSKEIMLEEKISRSKKYVSEVSVEAAYYKKKLKIINIVDRFFISDIDKINNLKFFKKKFLHEGVEIGHVNPSLLPESIILKIRKIYKKIFENFNTKEKLITLKLDILINDKNEPVVLEMTPRTSGGWDSCYSNIIIGGNLLKNLLKYIMGSQSASKTYKELTSYKKIKKRIFVLAVPENKSKNCIGREFFAGNALNLNSSLKNLIKKTLTKFKKGDKIEPINII
jgi:hypothetical protein